MLVFQGLAGQLLESCIPLAICCRAGGGEAVSSRGEGWVGRDGCIGAIDGEGWPSQDSLLGPEGTFAHPYPGFGSLALDFDRFLDCYHYVPLPGDNVAMKAALGSWESLLIGEACLSRTVWQGENGRVSGRH